MSSRPEIQCRGKARRLLVRPGLQRTCERSFRARNRLDFRRIVRIGVVMGWPSQSRPLKGSPRDLRDLGRASVKSGAANQRSLNMSTPSIAKSRNLKTAASKKKSVQSSATTRRKVTSAAATAKVPPKSDEPKVERVTKQERLLAQVPCLPA